MSDAKVSTIPENQHPKMQLPGEEIDIRSAMEDELQPLANWVWKKKHSVQGVFMGLLWGSDGKMYGPSIVASSRFYPQIIAGPSHWGTGSCAILNTDLCGS